MQLKPLADPRAAQLIASLALMYLRHSDAPRAVALGIAAMKLAPASPALALTVGTAFLRVGDADQALAVLSRFDGDAARLSVGPDTLERIAAMTLTAKAYHRLGQPDRARAVLAQAHALRRGAP